MTFSAAAFDQASAGDPHAREQLAVYADELATAGDALAEFVHFELRSDASSDPLAQLELTTRVLRSFGLGSRDLQALSFEWKLGFVDTLTVKWTGAAPEAAVQQVLASTACRFVRKVRLQSTSDASWFAKVEGLESLERLSSFSCTGALEKFRQLAPRLPQLKQLSLEVDALPQVALALPALRSLEVRVRANAPAIPKLFAKPPWQALESLTVLGLDVPVDAVLEQNPQLKSLTVRGGPLALVSLSVSASLGQLERLTVRNFEDLAPLVAARESLRNVKLHLEQGTCRPEQLGTLRATVKSVTWANVHEPARPGEPFQRKLK